MDWFGQVRRVRDGVTPLADAVYSKERMVRAEAARRADLTARQGMALCRDSEPLVRTLMAMRPGLDADCVDLLSYDSDVHVLRALAARDDLTDGQRRRLAACPDAVVQSLLGRSDAADWLLNLPFEPDMPIRKGLFG